MGKRHGVGRLEKSNGEIYVGEWENDRPRGKGILIGKQNEQVFYVGDFFEGLYQGQGTLYDLEDNISEEGSDDNLSGGAVAGIAVGCAIAGGVLGAAAVLLLTLTKKGKVPS